MPIVGGSGVSVAPRGAGDPSVTEPMSGGPAPGSLDLEQVLINGDEANGQIIHGGSAALVMTGGSDSDFSGGTISLLPSIPGTGGVASINGGDSQGGDSLNGGDLLLVGGAGDAGFAGGNAVMSGGRGNSGFVDSAVFAAGGGGDGTGNPGANADVQAGNGDTGEAGGNVTLSGGIGDTPNDPGAFLQVRGGDGAGNPGKISMSSGGSTGSAGEVPVADGAGAWDWGSPGGGGPVRPLEIIVDGGGSDIATGLVGYLYVPYDGTIVSGVLLGDASGDVVVDVWNAAFGSFPPTNIDSITGAAPLELSSSQSSIDSTLTGWTTAVAAGDVIAFNVDSVTGIAKLTICLNIQPT